MGFLDGLLKAIPVVGPVIGGVMSAIEGGKQARQSARANDASNALLAEQLEQVRRNQELTESFLPLYRELLADPYGAASRLGMGADGASYLDPYSPVAQEALYQQFGEDTLRGYNNAADALGANTSGRGIVGSNVNDYRQSLITRDAGSDMAKFARSLRVQGGMERYNRAIAREDQVVQRLAQMLPMFTGIGGANASQIGGIGGVYASKAGQAGQNAAAYGNNFAQSLAALAKVGAKMPGSNRTGTNVGPQAYGTSNVYGMDLNDYTIPGLNINPEDYRNIA